MRSRRRLPARPVGPRELGARLDSPSPDAFLAGYPARVRRVAAALRRLVLDTVPGAGERVRRGWCLIGYRTPSASGSRYFCFIAPERERARLGFEYGVLLDDPRGLLHGRGTQIRYVACHTLDDVRRDGMTRLIADAAAIARLRAVSRAAPVTGPALRSAGGLAGPMRGHAVSGADPAATTARRTTPSVTGGRRPGATPRRRR